MSNLKKVMFLFALLIVTIIGCSKVQQSRFNFKNGSLNNIISNNIGFNNVVNMSMLTSEKLEFCPLSFLYDHNKQDTIFKEIYKDNIDLKKFYYDIDHDLMTRKKMAENHININFCTFNDKNYLCIDELFIDKIYDENEMDKLKQIRNITDEYIINLVEHVHNYFKTIKSIDGYAIVINWNSKESNSGSYSLGTPHTLCFISPRSIVNDFNNQKITDKKLIKNTTILYGSEVLTGNQKANRIAIY